MNTLYLLHFQVPPTSSLSLYSPCEEFNPHLLFSVCILHIYIIKKNTPFNHFQYIFTGRIVGLYHKSIFKFFFLFWEALLLFFMIYVLNYIPIHKLQGLPFPHKSSICCFCSHCGMILISLVVRHIEHFQLTCWSSVSSLERCIFPGPLHTSMLFMSIQLGFMSFSQDSGY